LKGVLYLPIYHAGIYPAELRIKYLNNGRLPIWATACQSNLPQSGRIIKKDLLMTKYKASLYALHFRRL
jgi:hypothetical protein